MPHQTYSRPFETTQRSAASVDPALTYFNRQDYIVFIVLEFKPSDATQYLPCLPAYIIFMCIRYTDFNNDEEKVSTYLKKFYAIIYFKFLSFCLK